MIRRPSLDPAVDAVQRIDAVRDGPRCRICGEAVTTVFVDLGAQPLCESYLDDEGLHAMEPFYPLRVFVCETCLLVQAEDFATPEQIFREYAYFSSYSASWLEHAERFCAAATDRLALGPDSFVVELASNDGYLLRNFVRRGIRVLGVEPARNVAEAAAEAGVPTLTEFFGASLARDLVAEGKRADLLVANNVLAHVPDLHDFVEGMAILLGGDGMASIEFPHLLRLIRGRQFDTIYHEHFSYLSLWAVEQLLGQHGLAVVDAEELPTHGGSLRLWVGHEGRHAVRATVSELRRLEERFGLQRFESYLGFEEEVRLVKRRLLKLLIDARENGLKVAGYGAPGKGNTLLNYCGIRQDLLAFTVDRNPYKQGKYLPGTHIPVFAPELLETERPDRILILPWNLQQEIVGQLDHARGWGARFVVPIPMPAVLP